MRVTEDDWRPRVLKSQDAELGALRWAGFNNFFSVPKFEKDFRRLG